MSNFDLAMQFVKIWEGGYSNHPNDRGGPTQFGITQAIFNTAKQQGVISNTITSVKNLNLNDAKIIYQEMYWDEVSGDALPKDLSIALFDTAVNIGVGRSVKMLQTILNVTQDGIIGPQTLSAIENYNGNLVNDFLNARETGYKEIVQNDSSQGVFLKGWLNRVNSLRDYIDTINESNYQFKQFIGSYFWPIVNPDDWQILFTTSTSLPPPAPRGDPLILDLDGDGTETAGVADGAYFDHDTNGFAEQTGWAGSDDGLLVWDRNGNGVIDSGRELFGDQTILKTGARASHGFQALAEWDGNLDGKIDVNDSIWSNLKIWRDFDGDGRIIRKWEIGSGKWESRDCKQNLKLQTIDYSWLPSF
ncbi:hypothetical protein FJZ33_01225 [Candidatus Poribacteria bacterium]|nr:hypothetical protein [Candidatus Poribacteria bacterium]